MGGIVSRFSRALSASRHRNGLLLSGPPSPADEAIAAIDRVCIRLCRRIDNDSAWGWPKLHHMRLLASEADEKAAFFGLNQEEAQLFKVVLRAHDIGRHLQALGETGRSHGVMSVELLAANGILRKFQLEEQQAIFEAVQYHSERRVPAEISAVGYKLCYCLRDLDKREIFEEDEIYRDPPGVWKEMKIHHLPYLLPHLSAAQIARLRPLRYEELIARCWHEARTEEAGVRARTVEEAVIQVMNGCVEPRTLAAFLRHELPDSSWFRGESMATYVLYQTAQIFDVHSEVVLEQILHGHGVAWRLAFLRAKCTEAVYQRLEEALRTYCGLRNVAERAPFLAAA